MKIKGVGNSTQYIPSKCVELELQLRDGNYLPVKTCTIPQVSSVLPKVNWQRLKYLYPHLRDLSLYTTGGTVDLLLGTDNMYRSCLSSSHDASFGQECSEVYKNSGPLIQVSIRSRFFAKTYDDRVAISLGFKSPRKCRHSIGEVNR